MIIAMHCGGMPFHGNTINEQSLGGSETAAYYVAKELAARGHRVTLFTSFKGPEKVYDGVKYIWHGQVTERAPLGELFHFYATNTPHDVCIIQRMPGAFVHKFASKLNIVWLHDLALYRQRGMLNAAAWNIDGVFTVSEYHKKQVCEVYALNEAIVFPVTNGVDLSLFNKDDIDEGFPRPELSLQVDVVNVRHPLQAAPLNQTKLLYTSRPERGLENLVKPDGIMDQLYKLNPNYHLYVCNYNNHVPQLADYYDSLYARINEMPNATLLGHLTKQQLASIMRQCDALVYPTAFEEVSCITAMEAAAAGLPLISSSHAALPETTKGGGVVLLPLENGEVNVEAFTKKVHDVLSDHVRRDSLRGKQLKKAGDYSWGEAVGLFEGHIRKMFEDRNKNPETVLRHLIHVSDYYAAEKLAEKFPTQVGDTAQEEMRLCYRFARERDWKNHYEAYYEYEKKRGVVYGPENLENNTRYNTVAGYLTAFPAGSTVLDYGCAHGHYTINLAKRYPELNFVGIDITTSNIDAARKWATEEGVKNVTFKCGAVNERDGGIKLSNLPVEKECVGTDGALVLAEHFDAIIAAEVLEHVEAPWDLVDALARYLKPSGKMITTTPIGPWEAIGYKEHWPWRAHVHHLEREDLYDLFGHHGNFKVNVTASGADKAGDVLGSYVCCFDKPTVPSGRINYERKFSLLNPRQTLAVCVIAKDAELNLGRCLDAVKDIADEIIVAVDEKTQDETRVIAAKYVKGFSPRGQLLFDIPSPMEIGFDEARNLCIQKAKADWIMWVDADEVVYQPHNVLKYLRQNQYLAYAVKQIHYSVEPASILKVDLPSRLFRNHQGVRFFGVVHEHPETELNKGIGHITVIEDVNIGHYGYSTEDVRRARFDRNINLLVRDREKYPDRTLGKLLWLRDLAQMCGWELEHNGGVVTPVMQERAKIGLKMWEELLDLGQTRMIADPDNLRFYSTLVQIQGNGFDFGFKMDVSKLNGGANPDRQPPLIGKFASRTHAEKLFLKLLNERTQHYDSRYF